MQSDMLMFTVTDPEVGCVPMPARHLAKLGIFETTHLERWIVDHPEVLGDGQDVEVLTSPGSSLPSID